MAQGENLRGKHSRNEMIKLSPRRTVIVSKWLNAKAGTPPTRENTVTMSAMLVSRLCLPECKFRFEEGYDFRNFRTSCGHQRSNA